MIYSGLVVVGNTESPTPNEEAFQLALSSGVQKSVLNDANPA